MAARLIPEGLHALNPMIITERPSELFDFLARVFGAKLEDRFDLPDGRPAYIDARIGDTVTTLMSPEEGSSTTQSVFYVYLPDVDAAYQRGLQFGAKSLQEPMDKPHGDRMAGLADSFGNQWWIATHLEDLSKEELHQRISKMWSEEAASAPP